MHLQCGNDNENNNENDNDNDNEDEDCAAELRLIVARRQVNSDGVAG